MRVHFLSTISAGCVLLHQLLQSADAVTPSPGCFNNNGGGLGDGMNPGESQNFSRNWQNTQSRTHKLTLPNNYDPDVPSPLMLYFHGWGGSQNSCGSACTTKAPEKGMMSVAMSGYGSFFYGSWKFNGSVHSPGPEGATCVPGATDYCNRYSNQDCDCSMADNCWWTTCYDSVGQVLAVLDEVENDLCVDLDSIWAVGCSNGGMFTFEMASDPRASSRIAGIVPHIGLPHYGFSTGPGIDGIPMFGMWGVYDTTVPPISNTGNPDSTLEPGGWYYTALTKVMSDWTDGNSCSGVGQDPLDPENDYGTSDYPGLVCTQGCSERGDGVRVVGCLFQAGHICGTDEIWEPSFNFMLSESHSSQSPSVSPTPPGAPCYDSSLDVAGTSIGCPDIVAYDACSYPGASSHCPFSCDACDAYGCSDSEFSFDTNSGLVIDCDVLAGLVDVDFYCTFEPAYSTCRETCGVCL